MHLATSIRATSLRTFLGELPCDISPTIHRAISETTQAGPAKSESEAGKDGPRRTSRRGRRGRRILHKKKKRARSRGQVNQDVDPGEAAIQFVFFQPPQSFSAVAYTNLSVPCQSPSSSSTPSASPPKTAFSRAVRFSPFMPPSHTLLSWPVPTPHRMALKPGRQSEESTHPSIHTARTLRETTSLTNHDSRPHTSNLPPRVRTGCRHGRQIQGHTADCQRADRYEGYVIHPFPGIYFSGDGGIIGGTLLTSTACTVPLIIINTLIIVYELVLG